MRLSVLASTTASAGDPDISGLTADSRAVKPGYLFAALPGTKADGTAFLDDALRRGAVAVLGSDNEALSRLPVPVVADTNPRRRLAMLAARFYGRQPETIVAVTGTNGKTSVASFVRQIWASLGLASASFGTIGVVSPSGTRPLGHTTPDPVEIHRLLAELADEGVAHAAFEASSHGLSQYRVDGVVLKAAGFTNLTRDHLDYHETLEAYECAKLRLFSQVLPRGAVAVINADSPSAPRFAQAARDRGQVLIRVGEAPCDLHIRRRVPQGNGQMLSLAWDGRQHEILLPLAGAFQASNAVVAAGLVLGTGGDAAAVLAALERLAGAAGRLERAGVTGAGVPVYIDYAHTPDALETVLKALRPHTPGRIWVVFGCGGDRDAGKRPLMGQAASAHADRVIVTDDNPRTEVASAIRQAVLTGARGAEEIADRAEAIDRVIAASVSGDTVVIAGKGHETGQIVGQTVRPFSDMDEARGAIARTGGQTS